MIKIKMLSGGMTVTIQQLKYAITVAEKGSITEASKDLYISQPSLSGAIKEGEKEATLTIFNRRRAGVALATEGMEFWGYARQVVQQMEFLESRYIDNRPKNTFLRIYPTLYIRSQYLGAPDY